MVCEIEGVPYLAAFNDRGKLFQFYMKHGTADDEQDHLEAIPNLEHLRLLVNGFTYARVVINPGCDDEAAYSAADLRRGDQ